MRTCCSGRIGRGSLFWSYHVTRHFLLVCSSLSFAFIACLLFPVLFADAQRAVQLPSQITEEILELLRNKKEFTFMASIQQKTSTSGVLFSIHESDFRYSRLSSQSDLSRIVLTSRCICINVSLEWRFTVCTSEEPQNAFLYH